MLSIDSHGSHVLLVFIEYCTQNQRVAFRLPPHTNHILQPLDVAIFGSLTNADKLLIKKMPIQKWLVC